ncbi:MAG: metallophosphoesterase [Trueperaceae bacterium]
MRVAVISDTHGNLAALEATLEHLSGEYVDQVVVAGDLVNGAADSVACWRLIRSLGYPVVRGNHERYVFDLGTPNEEPEWGSELFGPVRWAAARFSPEELDEMRVLPLRHSMPDYPELLIVHASPHADNQNVLAHTPSSELEPMFAGSEATLIVRGHNHIGNSRTVVERQLVTAGSVGMPLGGTVDAQFLLLERRAGRWRFEHRAVPYDVGATLRRFSETGYLAEAGPMARLLLREIVTGSHQMVPFLRFWRRVSPDESLPLTDAIDRFLNAY